MKWESPIGVGSLIVVTAQRFGRRTAAMMVTAWEPTRKIGVEVRSGGAKARAVITMEPVEVDKTRLTRSASIEIGGLLKLIQPYLSYRANKDRSVELDNVKRILETQRPST